MQTKWPNAEVKTPTYHPPVSRIAGYDRFSVIDSPELRGSSLRERVFAPKTSKRLKLHGFKKTLSETLYGTKVSLKTSKRFSGASRI